MLIHSSMSSSMQADLLPTRANMMNSPNRSLPHPHYERHHCSEECATGCLVMRKSSTGPANRVAMNGSVQRFADPHDVTNAQDLSEVPPHAEPSSSVGPALDSRTYSVVGYHFGLLSRKPGFESWYVRQLPVSNSSCERLNARYVATQNEVVNIVSTFVCFHGFQICHVAHHWVFV